MVLLLSFGPTKAETRAADRVAEAPEGAYSIVLHVVSRTHMAELGTRLGYKFAPGGLTVWKKFRRPKNSVTHVYIVAPFTYGLLAHELRHVFEHDSHFGREVPYP